LRTATAASTYSQLIVFGDSLSDVGNAGRHSAGALWDENLAGSLGLPLLPSSQGGTDYAIAGAAILAGGSTSLPGQVATYLTAHPVADPHALYVIWGGGNDVLSTRNISVDAGAVSDKGVAKTLGMIQALYNAGGRYFVIGSVPRTDLTPLIRAGGPAMIAQQAALVTLWNTKLRAAVRAAAQPATRLWYYDDATAIDAVVKSPTHFGFTNYTNSCASGCADPAHTLFWDAIHPGATEHAIIGGSILALVTQ
jgi:outer membrane lipase/esterase